MRKFFLANKRGLRQGRRPKSPLVPTPPTYLDDPFYSSTVAFEGAFGYGALTTGGRGNGTLNEGANPNGTMLYEVTNLNDSGAGSLRAAMEATEKRVIVPKVSGWVELASRIEPSDNYTFLGMLSPGGLGVRHNTSPVTSESLITHFPTSNFILRYLTLRSDTVTTITTNDALRIAGCSDGIVDHVSASYATDGVSDMSNSSNITIQDCLFTYPLTGDPEGDHEFIMLAAPSVNPVTVARTIFNNARGRVPEAGRGAKIQFVGNVIYNCRQKGLSSIYSGYNVSEYNYQRNTILQGNTSWDTMSGSHLPFAFRNRHTGTTRRDVMYMEGNACPVVIADPTIISDQENLVYVYSAIDDVTDPSRDPAEWLTVTPFDMPELPELMSAADFYTYVLSNAGNVLFRDSVDNAAISEIENDTGQFGNYSTGAEAGGWPAFTSGTYPTAADGVIADAWRTANSETRNWYEVTGTGRLVIENYADDVAQERFTP